KPGWRISMTPRLHAKFVSALPRGQSEDSASANFEISAISYLRPSRQLCAVKRMQLPDRRQRARPRALHQLSDPSRRSEATPEHERKNVVNAQEKARELREQATTLYKAAPPVMQGFQSIMLAVAKDGALSAKTKELMAVAISISAKCEGCIVFHVQ